MIIACKDIEHKQQRKNKGYNLADKLTNQKIKMQMINTCLNWGAFKIAASYFTIVGW